MAPRNKRRARPETPAPAGLKTRLYETSPKSQVREMFESICVAVILAFFVRTFVVQAFKIPSA
jgi:signal peptidase I